MSTTPRERPILFSGPMVRAILEGRKAQTRRVVKGVSAETEFAPDFHTNFPEHGMDAVRFEDGHAVFEYQTGIADTREHRVRCPFGQPGNRLWVKETWRAYEHSETGVDGIMFQADNAFIPIANTREAADLWAEALHVKAKPKSIRPTLDGGKYCVWTPKRHAGWRPSRYMPRWASRITLEITRVRVERVRDITEADAIAEGVTVATLGNAGWLGPDAPEGAGYSYVPRGFAATWDDINGPRGFGWSVNPWVWVIDFERIKP